MERSSRRQRPGPLARHRSRKGAFTLIELLVVISIIALLIGILLPALGAARSAARTSVCLSHERSFGQAIAAYAANNRDWLPGPITSGFKVGNSGYVFHDQVTEPTQNMDWISPTLGDSLGLPKDREERIIAIFNDEFRCPANDVTYDGAVGWTGPSITEVNYSSYSAALGFHFAAWGNIPNPINNLIEMPKQYGPRLDMAGSASDKVWAFDGARYVDRGNNQITYNGWERQIRGGNFMEFGPALAYDNGPWEYDADGEPDALSLRLGYRHQGSMNAIFLDGHGQTMQPEEAQDFNLWFPTGALIGGGPDKIQ
jgi:prepilin-type N-terminal cleavage/methylation domain-containing protein/prepilin-type processing-associated H-X9-DG protein